MWLVSFFCVVFGRPFVKRFALCYWTIVLSVTLVYCGQTVGWIKMKLGRQVRLRLGHIVLDGDPAAPPTKGHKPPHSFRPHICCGQMTGWMKMPLGTKVGLGPGNLVLDADPALPARGTAPNFRPMSVVAKRLDGSKCHLVRR